MPEIVTRFAEAEPGKHFVARRLVGGGGQGDARHARIAFVQRRQLQVFRPKIVAPLRDAVSLVDCEQCQLAGFT